MSEFDAILDNEAAPLTHFYDAGGGGRYCVIAASLGSPRSMRPSPYKMESEAKSILPASKGSGFGAPLRRCPFARIGKQNNREDAE